MGCDCKWAETVLSLIILVFTLWPTAIFSAMASKWLVVLSAVVLLVHSLSCRNLSCKPVKSEKMPVMSKAKKSAKKKR